MGYHDRDGKNGYVYILSNYKRNIFYIGVTSALPIRITEHKKNKGCKFTKKYHLKYLMYYEEFPNIVEAISREKQLKNWHRQWKINLIKQLNPSMKDLAFNLNHPPVVIPNLFRDLQHKIQPKLLSKNFCRIYRKISIGIVCRFVSLRLKHLHLCF